MSELFNLYEKAMNDFLFGRESSAIASARNWISTAEENPFEVGTEAHDLFFSAKKNYTLWQSGAINSRVSGRRFEQNVKQLLALEMLNPYTQEKPKHVMAVVEPAAEPIHVTGVLPEQKRGFFKKKR